ncbi:MAG: TIGR03435 family protein [Acidobacteriia bacterium]|nr:TIGR03435 family protein [Terriglobia bacterium]
MTFGRLLTGWVVAASELLLVNGSVAQPLPDSSFSYVASITPSQPGTRGFSEYLPGGRLTATAVTLRTLVRLAYRIQDYQLVEAPEWLATKRYDINAKVEDSPAPPQPVLLRALLKDRFGLRDHNETRQLPTFELMLAREGRLGPRLKQSDFDCAAYARSAHAPPEPGRPPTCATNIRMGALTGRSISMAQLATSLAPFLNRFTIDRTALTGGFDVEFTWTPEAAPAPDAGAAESIYSALPDQLGLKLVSGKGPVEVLVVDRVQEPSAN